MPTSALHDTIKSPRGESLLVEVTIACGDIPLAPGGYPLDEREDLTFCIPAAFPFEIPFIKLEHDRFAGHPHVHWNRRPCLYQAPNTEWNPADGMFGFLDRVAEWLQLGAAGELAAVGAALHPPVAYRFGPEPRTVVIRADTPSFEGDVWCGVANLRIVSERRVDLLSWSESGSQIQGVAAAAILLKQPFPYEFPVIVSDLLSALSARGVPLDTFYDALFHTLSSNGPGVSLYVLIGTPMRGVRGSSLHQHLAVCRRMR